MGMCYNGTSYSLLLRACTRPGGKLTLVAGLIQNPVHLDYLQMPSMLEMQAAST